MSRIPASAGVALAGLLPLSALALGLGEVEPKSYLNQPFAADIPVFAETAAELAGLKVSLASPDTFAQYGLPSPGAVGDFNFAVVPGARGGVIHVTSTRPVTEPFLTLLLEIQWPQGRLLREYTVLLDPPAFTGGAVRQPVQAPASTAPAMAAPVATAPPATGGAAPGPAAVASASAGGATHTVERNETLWGIAERHRPEGGVDINQVMMAIYRANPQAFAGNINRLNAGAVLRIPDQASIAGTERSEADAEVHRQYQEWQQAAPQAPAARLELVPPPAETAGAAAASPAAAGPASPKLAAEVEESRRLLAVKDAELQALRKRVADLEKQGGSVAVPGPTPPPATGGDIEAETAEPPAGTPATTAPGAVEAPATGEAAAPAQPVRARPAEPARPKAGGQGVVGTIGQLLGSIWLWLAAAVVLVGALLVARRRSGTGERAAWQPTPARGRPRDAAQPVPAPKDDMIVIEERAQATGGLERRTAPRGEEETALERTISTESGINLDQSDPLAEAEFHVAYGLYDQAADILTAAIAREPARRELQLKLLDVFFGWENREGFLKGARALRERLGSEADPDWKRVCIMGKQLCPGEALFAGAAAPAAEEMDLAFGSDEGATADRDSGGDTGLDFDLSGIELDADAPTKIAPSMRAVQTQEIPTIEAPGPGPASTMETPTIESPELSPTMETPTIETRAVGRTMETPTLEAPGIAGTARLQGLHAAEEHYDQTAEIDLEDLGLDLTGLDEAARDMATGLQEALPGGGGIDFDLSDAAAGGDGDEGTAGIEGGPTLDQFNSALARADAGPAGVAGDDTAEQPAIQFPDDATLSTQRLGATSDQLESLDLDLGFGETDVAGSDLTSTGIKAISGRRPEDPTMTEVGTKLDLARAYMDMEDKDGARSILNEVLEEGDPGQRQEARQLLDSLNQ